MSTPMTPHEFGDICGMVARGIHAGQEMQTIAEGIERTYPALDKDDIADVIETAEEGWYRLQENE